MSEGLILVNTGEGKGKTTAALGLGLRAAGHGMKVLMLQFFKGPWPTGECTAVKRLEPDFKIIPLGQGFIKTRKKNILRQPEKMPEHPGTMQSRKSFLISIMSLSLMKSTI